MSTLSASLLLASAGCVSDSTGGGKDRPASETQLRGTKTSLSRANSCDDLLGKIQDDAIAKLDLSVAAARQRWQDQSKNGGEASDDTGSGISDFPVSAPGSVGAVFDAGVSSTVPIASPLPPGSNAGTATVGGTSGAAIGGVAGGGGTGGVGQGPAGDPAGPRDSDEESGGDGASGNAATGASDPIGASGTNTQVKEVDEADFVKLVDSGRGMFLLHGDTLKKLKTYPPQQLSIEPPELKIEGSPSELFVTDDGRAVIFSSVYGYPSFGGASSGDSVRPSSPIACEFGKCGDGGYYGGGSITKITIADVSGDKLSPLRELYYQGNYVSSRRYDQIVRVVVQSEQSFDNLYQPELDGYDPWGRPYEQDVIDEQLEQWRDRIAASVRNTKLSDWVPTAKELKNGSLVDLAPGCDSYFVPQPGFSDSGLVQVLSLDVSKNDAAVGGVSVMGRASTVYSSVDRLILAQPDYRWLDDGGPGDLGFIDAQRTTLHAFGLDADKTTYLASGWVPGHLPQQNQQFGLDETAGHTLRIVTTGQKRSHPDAQPNSQEFWQTETVNLVSNLHEDRTTLKVVGTSDPLGHVNETVQSSRFVGDRVYVVTFRQTDPLIVLDLSNDAEPVVIGEIEIPGFGQYMHPLDDDHLITFGRSGSGGSQLQLFDVKDPLHIPQPKTLDFGSSSSSETAYNHKAFTYYAPLGLIALPVSAARQGNGTYAYVSALRVIHVDPSKGFELLGSIDHSAFADANYGCISCGPWGCQTLCTAGSPEVRRGAFVESSDASYVYAIGYGGVTVNDLKDLATPIAKVKLPAATGGSGPWYTGGLPSSGGGFFGGASGGGTVAVNPVAVATPPSPGVAVAAPAPTMSPVPAARDAGALPPAVDAGAAIPAADAGVDVAQDAG